MFEALHILTGWHFVTIAGRAFSQPWRGTPDQWVMVFAGCCLVLIAATLLYVWRRDGGAVLAQRFRDMPRQVELARARANQRSGPARFFNLLLWIGIVLALVFWFNWKQSQGG